MPNKGSSIRAIIQMGASGSKSEEFYHKHYDRSRISKHLPGGERPHSPMSDREIPSEERQSEIEIPTTLTARSGQPFKVLNIEVKIDKKITHIDESSVTVLKYKTPHFRATATVQVPPLQKDDRWQIGWIQACTFMKFINTYGNEGCSSWEFPELTTGKYRMISDSDGRHYPWYGNKGVVATCEGPSKIYQTICVGMTDNFYPHITWVIPIEGERRSKLTHIVRNQTFYTWLVARDIKTDTYHILKTTTWTFWLEINVDPDKPLGQRARLVGPWEQKEPQILDENIPIEPNAMKPPNANSAQILVWRPARGTPKIIIPPKWRQVHTSDRRERRESSRSRQSASTHESPRTRGKSRSHSRSSSKTNQRHSLPNAVPHKITTEGAPLGRHGRNWGNNVLGYDSDHRETSSELSRTISSLAASTERLFWEENFRDTWLDISIGSK